MSTDTPSDCKVSQFSSRGCERGTLGCDVVHGPQVMIESLRRELAALKAECDALRVDAEKKGNVVRAAIEWAFCPMAGGYTNGPAVEDTCEALDMAVKEYIGANFADVLETHWTLEEMHAAIDAARK